MSKTDRVYDVVIIGAGPGGLACAIDAKKRKLDYLVIEKGCLVNTLFNLPRNLVFFSTPDLLEIGNLPFITSGDKPTRSDLLKYYRKVADYFELNIKLYQKVETVDKTSHFVLHCKSDVYHAKNIVLATGQYDHANPMQIPGEEMAKVSHYFVEAHPYYRKKVAVIGGKNSAVEAALELARTDAEVTLIHRGSEFTESVKYWILPDIYNRIKQGRIAVKFNSVVKEIRQESILIEGADSGLEELDNDFVLALTGYKPDYAFFSKLGLELDEKEAPVHDPKTLQTNVTGIYIAGVVIAGCDGGKVFIENSRHHGELIMGNITNGKDRNF